MNGFRECAHCGIQYLVKKTIGKTPGLCDQCQWVGERGVRVKDPQKKYLTERRRRLK